MANETGNFRTSTFGGFNRQDVSDYIEKLSLDRNRYKDKSEELAEKVDTMQERIDELTKRLTEMESRLLEAQQPPTEKHAAIIEKTVTSMRGYKAALAEAAEKIGAFSVSMSDELIQLRSQVETLPQTLDKACSKLDRAIEKLERVNNKG